MEKVTDLTARLAAPIVEEQGCSLWDVEYVKEAGTWYLRVLIDKEGGVDILDCENISRALSDLLDEADPNEGSYTLEVGSAGAERVLKRPADFQRYLNSPVLVKLYKPVDGRKEFPGTLTAYNEAKRECENLVNYIDAIINTAMNGGDPMTVQEPSASCTGSCSTCGGCH